MGESRPYSDTDIFASPNSNLELGSTSADGSLRIDCTSEYPHSSRETEIVWVQDTYTAEGAAMLKSSNADGVVLAQNMCVCMPAVHMCDCVLGCACLLV
jgi:hypothetical protein